LSDSKPKLLITVEKSNSGYKPALVDSETHSILKELSVQTGVPTVKLIAKSVRFAMDYIVVVGEGNTDQLGC